MKYYKHKHINECDCGGVSAPMQTVNNTVGIGNPTPAQMAGTTAAEMSDPRCIGSGDKFGGSEIKSKKKTKLKKRKKVNEGFSDVFDASLVDYSKDFEQQDEFYKVSTLIEQEFLFKHINVSKTNEHIYLNEKHRNMFYYIDKNNEEYQIHLINPYEDNIYIYFSIVRNGLEEINELPYKIVECQGSLTAENLGLTTLKNFPEKIDGYFYCQYNKLHTLEGGPTIVYDTYNVQHNRLKKLNGMPKHILKSEKPSIWWYEKPTLDLRNNPTLKSKEGLIDVDYNIWFPASFYNNANSKYRPPEFISSDEVQEIHDKLKGYYKTFDHNFKTNTITIDNYIRISKTPKSNYHLALRWNLNTSHPSEAGFGKNWDVDTLIKEFIKRKERGTF